MTLQPLAVAGVPRAKEVSMLRRFLISVGCVALILAGCNPEFLIAKPDPSDYEVVTLVAV